MRLTALSFALLAGATSGAWAGEKEILESVGADASGKIENGGDDDDDDNDLDDLDDSESAPAAPKDHVVALGDTDFHEFVQKHEKVLAEFYAPWCGHCKQLEPQWSAAAKTLAERKRKSKLAKIDATVHSRIAGEHNVQGYPTIVFYNNGVKSEYNGPRDATGIVEWLEKREKNALELCPELDEATEEGKLALAERVKEEYGNGNTLVVARVPRNSGKYNALKKAANKLFSLDRLDSTVVCAVPLGPKGKGKMPKKGSEEFKKLDAGSKITLFRDKKMQTCGFHSVDMATKDDASTEKWLNCADRIAHYPTDAIYNADKVARWIERATYPAVGSWVTQMYGPLRLEQVGAKLPINLFLDLDYMESSLDFGAEEQATLLKAFEDFGKSDWNADGKMKKGQAFRDQIFMPVVIDTKNGGSTSQPKVLTNDERDMLGVPTGPDGEKLYGGKGPLVGTIKIVNNGGIKKYVRPLFDSEDGLDKFKTAVKNGDTKALQAAFQAFAQEYQAGSIPVVWKTQPPPAGGWDAPETLAGNRYEEHVRILTGADFENVALSKNTDTFVEFYAPWCGHCKALAPKFSALAKKVRAICNENGIEEGKVVIGKFDATANECEEPVTGYPKLVFYPAAKNSMKKKQEFSGNRELDPMYDFVLENARNLAGVAAGQAPAAGKKKKAKGFNMVEREIERKKKAEAKKAKSEL